MSSILYFLPGVTSEQVVADGKLNPDTLERFGLAEILRDVQKIPHQVSVNEHRKGGPGDVAGVLIAPVSKHNGPPAMFTYKAGLQVWQPTAKGAFAGYIKVDPPTPYDLERQVIIPGAVVTDKHGRPWTVPLVRSPRERFGLLPKDFSFDPADGFPIAELQTDWQWLWDLAGNIRDYFVRDEDDAYQKPPIEWLVSAVVKVLAVNYRIGPTEINLLRECGANPLAQDFVWRVASASIDFDVVVEAKKNSPDSSDTQVESCSKSPPGDEAASPVTDQAGER